MSAAEDDAFDEPIYTSIADRRTAFKHSPASVTVFEHHSNEIEVCPSHLDSARKDLSHHMMIASELESDCRHNEDLDLLYEATRDQNVDELMGEHQHAPADEAASQFAYVVQEKLQLMAKLAARLKAVTSTLAKKERDIEDLFSQLESTKADLAGANYGLADELDVDSDYDARKMDLALFELQDLHREEIKHIKSLAWNKEVDHEDELEAQAKIRKKLEDLVREKEAELSKISSIVGQEQDARVKVSVAEAVKSIQNKWNEECSLSATLRQRVCDLESQRLRAQEEAKAVQTSLDAKVQGFKAEKVALSAALATIKSDSEKANASVLANAAAECSQHEVKANELEKQLKIWKEEAELSTKSAEIHYKKSVAGLETKITALEKTNKVLCEDAQNFRALADEATAGRTTAENQSADSNEKLSRANILVEELRAKCLHIKESKDSAIAASEIKRENLRASLSEVIEGLKGERDITKQKLTDSEVQKRATEKQLQKYTLAAKELEETVRRLEIEREQASADAAAEAKESCASMRDMDNVITSMQEQKDREISKMQSIVDAKEKKVGEAKALVDMVVRESADLKRERGAMEQKIANLETSAKKEKVRSGIALISLETEIQTLRQRLAEFKQDIANINKARQDECDTLRIDYEARIRSLENDKVLLTRQTHDLQKIILEPAHNVGTDVLIPSSTGETSNEANGFLVDLRKQKELTIQQVRTHMQATIDDKDRELESMTNNKELLASKLALLENTLKAKVEEIGSLKHDLFVAKLPMKAAPTVDDASCATPADSLGEKMLVLPSTEGSMGVFQARLIYFLAIMGAVALALNRFGDVQCLCGGIPDIGVNVLLTSN